MKTIIKSAKTIEEAVELGLRELGLNREDVDVEVIAEPTKALFGIFGGNDATVKIKEKTRLKIDVEDIFADMNSETSQEAEKEAEVVEVTEEIKPKTVEKPIVEKPVEAEKLEIVEDFNEKPDTKLEKADTVTDEYETFDHDEEDDVDEEVETEDHEEKEYEVFNSDKDSLVNTRDLEFSKQAEIVTDEDDIKTVAEKTKKNLEDLLVKMHIDAKVSYQTARDNIINLDLSDISENDTGIAIGSKGETLNALQYVLSLLTNRNTKKYYRVTLNVADYRDRRKKSIEQNAQKVAFKVLKTKKSIALKPMNSYERRIVHYALQSYKGIETVSTGKFPNRKVIVRYEGQ